MKDRGELESYLANAASNVLGQGEQINLKSSSIVATKLVEQVVNGRSRYLTEDDRLSVVGSVAFQKPASDSRKVRIMAGFRLQMQILEDADHMLPVLHHEHIGVVNDENLDGRQEIMVAVLLA